jgi:hypothetical protein
MGRSRNRKRCFCRKENAYCLLANTYTNCKYYDGYGMCNKSYSEGKGDDIVKVHCCESCFTCDMRGQIGTPYSENGVQYPGERCHIIETDNKKFLM